MVKLTKFFLCISFLCWMGFLQLFTFLYALDAGVAVDSEFIFLQKSDNPYYPQVVPAFDASFFLKHSFIFKQGSFSIVPGFFVSSEYNASKREIGKMTVLPYFRQLNLSVFAENFSFTFAKGFIPFGEGFFAINNYFFLNIPVKNAYKTALYHLSCEVSAKEFLFNFGSALDTYAIDRYKKPEWYSIWMNASYSNTIMTLGFVSDVLFEKDVTLRFASEASFFLPLDFKIYSSAKLPVNLKHKKITDWGIFLGVNKLFMFDDYSFVTILGASYGYDKWNYFIFQHIGIGEVASFTFGFSGKDKLSLNLLCEGEVCVSTFSLKITYLTRNLLKSQEDPQMSMRGLLKLGVSFNE